jgi:hypothetical protein
MSQLVRVMQRSRAGSVHDHIGVYYANGIEQLLVRCLRTCQPSTRVKACVSSHTLASAARTPLLLILL